MKTIILICLLFAGLFCRSFAQVSNQLEVEAWVTKPDRSMLFEKMNEKVFFSDKERHGLPIVTDELHSMQTIDGFGFALTGGSAEFIMKMTPEARKSLLEEVFSSKDNNIGVSYIRLTIGASDLNSFVFAETPFYGIWQLAGFDKIAFLREPMYSRIRTQVEETWGRAMLGWRVHDMKRPQPPAIDPGSSSTQETAGKAPSDAIALFDGRDLSHWESVHSGQAKWLVKDGYLEVIPGTGDIRTIDSFGDCQLHLEWRIPEHLPGDGHDSGNSGLFMMSKYEIQIFDSYRTKLYADGIAGAIYGEFPPDVNACIAPGKWQSYDIIFHRPHFDTTGAVVKPAVITVLLNGVLIQDNTEILGPTRWMSESAYESHSDNLPLTLQDHNNPMRFRNIWIRRLPKGPQDLSPELPKPISLPEAVMEQYVGEYGKGMSITIEHRDGKLMARIASLPFFELLTISENELIGKRVDSRFVIDRHETGKINGLTWYHSGINAYYIKTR